MAVIEDELQRLWQLLAELSSQLTHNREQSELLKKQAEDLKTQAIHTGTGYALKRFNVDLSQEQFESELERMNAQLVIENQTLQHENRQLAILIKDHENTLEQIMARFRSHAHSTQQHELELTKYYESVILSLVERQHQHHRSLNETHQFGELDPESFQIIQSISILIQKAIRELSGEEPELDELDETQQAELDSSDFSQPHVDAGHLQHSVQQDPTRFNSNVRFEDPFKPSQMSEMEVNANSIIPDATQRRKSTSVIDYRPRIRDPSSGGYVGNRKGSLSDYALMSAIESERLRKENDHLREMLGIAQDFSLQTPASSAYSSKFENIPDEDSSMSSEASHGFSTNVPTKVVNQVIKEEEEEEEEEEQHQRQHQQPCAGDSSAVNQPDLDHQPLSHHTYQPDSHSPWHENIRNDVDDVPLDHHQSDLRSDLINQPHS